LACAGQALLQQNTRTGTDKRFSHCPRSWQLTQLCLCCIFAVAGPAPDLANFTRAGCDNFTGDTWQPLRPAFHITVPYGWMNDPHGMFQLKDTVHLFFQYNPRDLAWGEGRNCEVSTGASVVCRGFNSVQALVEWQHQLLQLTAWA
jgi:hypothetical protein